MLPYYFYAKSLLRGLCKIPTQPRELMKVIRGCFPLWTLL